MRIVICDAHRVFADALASLLGNAGHQVAGSAVDLDEAVAMLGGAGPGGRPPGPPAGDPLGPASRPSRPARLRSESADACVLDLRVPRSGERPDIGRAVAAVPGTAFVGLSGSSDPSVLHHAIAAGVRGLALKGDDFGEFLGVLTEAVSSPGRAAPDHDSPGAAPVILSASARAALRRGDGLAAGPSQFLTDREREALGRLVRGESTAGMARGMGVRVSTARTHIDAVLCKLGAHNRLEAVAYAVREGLVDVSGWQVEQHAAGT